jgi:hypothetical protein
MINNRWRLATDNWKKVENPEIETPQNDASNEDTAEDVAIDPEQSAMDRRLTSDNWKKIEKPELEIPQNVTDAENTDGDIVIDAEQSALDDSQRLDEVRKEISGDQSVTPEDETGFEAEREKVLEMIRENGSSSVVTSLPKIYNPKGHSGFTVVPDDRRINKSELYDAQLMSSDRKKHFHDAGVNEVVGLVPEVVEEFESIDVPRGGLMGRLGQTEKKSQSKGYRPRKHNEIVNGGTSESAYSLTYEVIDDKNPIYRDSASNRMGQVLRVSIMLPESTSGEIWKHLKEDPEFIREIAKMIMTERVGVSEVDWSQGGENTRAPLRPPYEEWAKKEGGLKMYFQEPGDNNQTFNPDQIVSM